MEVILLEGIRNLGELGDMVSVKNGYARNFLIPYKKAIVANEENKANFEAKRAELEKAQTETLVAVQARADKLNGLAVTITVKAGEEGKLFGSVGPREVAEAITAAGAEVSKSEVQMPSGPIKAVGNEEVIIGLHPEVNVTVTVTIEAE